MSTVSGNPMSFLLFLDLETDGLEHAGGTILEVGVIGVSPTSDDWDVKFAFSEIARNANASLHSHLRTSPWMQMHRDNGLAEQIISGAGKRLDEIEALILASLDEHAAGADKIMLAGSGVAQFDIHWVREHMPRLADRVVYETIDVGHCRRLYRLATGRHLTSVNEVKNHRSMDDIHAHLVETLAFVDLFRFADTVTRGAATS